jgi:hypothetical protein
MQHLEGGGTPVIYIGRTVLKGQYNFWYNHSVLAAVRYAGQDGTLIIPEVVLIHLSS